MVFSRQTCNINLNCTNIREYTIIPSCRGKVAFDSSRLQEGISVYGSLSKNGGIQKGKIIKKYCPKFHFFSNIFINTNMEKIYGKYVQFKNMYNVSIVNYMDGTRAKMSVQSQTNFLIKNRQFKEFSKFKGVPLEILLKTLMGINLGLFGCGTCKRNTFKIDVQ